MCVIMSSGPGIKAPPISHIENANEENPHGWGVSINLPRACREHRSKIEGTCEKCRYNSQVVTMRGFETKALINAVEVLDALRTPESSLVVHCRIGTGGDISINNTHPFAVTDKLHLFHNGIFSPQLITIVEKDRPDSYHLAKIISPAVETDFDWILSSIFTEWLDKLCQDGYSNKILLLDAIYGNLLYNRDAWVDGLEGRIYSHAGPLTNPFDYATDEDFWKKYSWALEPDDNGCEDDKYGGYAPLSSCYDDTDDDFNEYATWKDDIKRAEAYRDKERRYFEQYV